MYYPAFKMEENPFRYWDRATEKKNVEGGFRIVKTSAIGMVTELIIGGSNSIVVGTKGCGKSTVVDSIEGEHIVKVSGSELFRELYNEIIAELWRKMDEQSLKMMSDVFKNSGKGEYLIEYSKDGRWATDSMICRDLRCPRRSRCNITNSRQKVIEQVKRNTPMEINCPLRQWLAIEICSMSGSRVYLFDVPDNMKSKDQGYFEQFVRDLFNRTGALIVLMVTLEQFAKLRKGWSTEYFMRWLAVDFPPPDGSELEEILKSRVDGVFPFDRDGLKYLIDTCGSNPRTLIRRSGDVLKRMKKEVVGDVVGRDYIYDIISGQGYASMTEMEGIVATVNRLWEERGTVWVLAPEFAELMDEWYGVKMSTLSIGKKVKKMPDGRRLERNEGASPRMYRMRRIRVV